MTVISGANSGRRVGGVADPTLVVEEGNRLGRPLGEGLELPEQMAEVARHYLDRAMQEAQGNKTRAAELVGLPSYQTLTNWLKKYGLRPQVGAE